MKFSSFHHLRFSALSYMPPTWTYCHMALPKVGKQMFSARQVKIALEQC